MGTNNNDEPFIKEDLILSFFDAWVDYNNDHEVTILRGRLINQAILNAYDDATQQKAFNAILYSSYGVKKGDEAIKNKAIQAKQIASRTLKKAIIELLNGIESFDIWHKQICGNLSSDGIARPNGSLMHIYSELDKAFSVGNAQKWVNMTVKYLYIYATFLDKMICLANKNPLQGILELKEDFHIPIDRYILKGVFLEETRVEINKKYELINSSARIGLNYVNREAQICFSTNKGAVTENAVLREINLREIKNDKVWIMKPEDSAYVSWSNIKYYENYMKIQDKIKECIRTSDKYINSPIEWENKVWSAVVQIENNLKHNA